MELFLSGVCPDGEVIAAGKFDILDIAQHGGPDSPGVSPERVEIPRFRPGARGK
jgi:hypothetical protein